MPMVRYIRDFRDKFDFCFHKETTAFMKYGSVASDALSRHTEL